MSKKIVLLVVLAVFVACNKYLDIKPVGEIIPTTVEDYQKFIVAAYNIPKNDKELVAYRADELKITPKTSGIEFHKDIYLWNDNDRAATTTPFSYVTFYKVIFYANEIINHKDNIQGDQEELNQLVGEAYALRALQYFDLVNLYAKPYNASTANTELAVPLVTKYDAEGKYPVSSLSDVYNQILSDVEAAEQLITVEKQPLGFNYRFSKISIASFKAKIYLYQRQWQKAIDAVEQALQIHSELLDLNQGVDVQPSEYHTTESILALDINSSTEISSSAFLSDELANVYDKNNDLRFISYFRNTSKGYKIRKNANIKYRCTFRTAELYLILAEAQVQLNKLDTAKGNLLKLAKHRYNSAGFANFEAYLQTITRDSLLTLVLKERQREFAIEGKRWFDLKRTTQPKLLKVYDSKTYTLQQGDDRYVLPFPKEAIINNPFLKK